ncbi:regulator of G-protein signaling 1 [Osmerus eperlanus]|uniref:regulator of G-protein signaling 1 n=1 Tax=Osmerus eperlanus TaxID=29151 RepID=UPI002E128B7B
MRRYSSEGSLLDMDFLPRRKVALAKDQSCGRDGESGTYTLTQEQDELDSGSSSLPPIIQEPGMSANKGGKGEMKKEHSVSVENFTELGMLEKGKLGVVGISEGCRAYSDSQLAPVAKGSMGRDGHPSTSPSNTSLSNPLKSHHAKARLSAAKLHLKSLFGQSPHSSQSNLFNTEQKDSAKERRSRLPFLRQWSQVGHSKTRFSREEMDKWAESLNTLLDSRAGVSVFGAFLRSEFSEENLQFYLACEQYRHSSNNFSLQRRARDICATYIQPGAPREVNLDSKTRELTMQLLQAPSHTSLCHAQKRIYTLLDTDCYPRFIQSNIYLSLLPEADHSP